MNMQVIFYRKKKGKKRKEKGEKERVPTKHLL